MIERKKGRTMNFGHKAQPSVAFMQFLVVFLMGFSHLVWLKPAVNGAKLASSLNELPKEVQQGERLGGGVVITDSEGLPKSTENTDAAEMTKETQLDHQGLQHLSESPERSGRSNAVSKDSFTADGAGSVTPPIVQEGRWARLKSCLRALFNKLLSLIEKNNKVVPTDAHPDLDLQVQAHLLQENKLKEYLLRRHGVEESAGAALVDKPGLQGSKLTLSIDDLLEEVYLLGKEHGPRRERWDKTPSSRPEADVDGLRQLEDSERVERAIEVERAAVREENSVMRSILAGNEAEASQRLRIVEVLHALAERYRGAISDPDMAKIFLPGLRRYTNMLYELFEIRLALIEWDGERRMKIVDETIEAAKKAKDETKIEKSEASRP